MASESSTTKDSRLRQRREAAQAAVDKEMTDSRFDGLRTRRARRALVVVWAATTAGVAAAVASDIVGSWALLGIVVWAVVFVALRKSVRSLADLPDYVLDERQVAVRDRIYVHAYQILAAIVLLLLFGLSIAADTHSFTYEQLSGAMWGALGLSFGLPSAVLAWSTSDT